jgi:hypothetical protein
MTRHIAGGRVSVLALAVAAVALSATAVAAAAAPVQGSIAGPITSVKGQTFTVKTALSPTGSSKVTAGSKTTITEQVAGKQADLQKGVCVVANGSKKGSVVVASRITISKAVDGKCGGGFGRGTRPGGGARPGGGSRPPGSRPPGSFGANFGFAFGAIAAVKGSTLTVHSRQRGSTTVTVSAKTQIAKTTRVGSTAIAVKLCAFVRGTSSDKGVTVQAENVALSKPGPNGCTSRFPGRG